MATPVEQMLSRISELQRDLDNMAERIRLFQEDVAALKSATDPAFSAASKLKALDDERAAVAQERAEGAQLKADLKAKAAQVQKAYEIAVSA